MARLVEDLLTLARSDAGGWKGEFAPVDIDTLLISLTERFLPAFSSNGITLSLDIPDDPIPSPHAEEMRSGQILSMLLDNAMSYTPAGGKVILSARARQNKLLIVVEDDDDGISDVDKPYLFERFYRSDRSRSDPKHFGLSLSNLPVCTAEQ